MKKPALIGVAVALVASAVTLLLIYAPEGEILSEAGLSRAFSLWQEKGPADYDVSVEVTGARPASYHVEVRGGKAVAATVDGRPVAERQRGVWSVAGIFHTMRTELANRADPKVPFGVDDPDDVVLRAAFDPMLGAPRYFLRHVVGRRSSIEWHVSLTPKQ